MCESDVESEEEYGGEDWGWGGGRPRSTFTGYCETLGPDEEDGGDEDRPRYVLHLNPRIGRRYDDEEENVEDESAAGKTLLTELVLTLVHEMIHAYLQAYACVGSECGCASNALEAVGASHHGPVFQGLQHAVGASLAGWPESGGLLGLLDGDSVRRFLRMDYEREAERAATAERFGSPAWSLALVQRPHEPPHCFAGVIVDLDGVAVDVEELHEACCPLVPLAERMTADAERGDAECSSSEAAVAGTDDDVADSEGTFAQRGCRWAWSTIGFFMGRFSSGGAGNNGDPGTECRMKLA
ncbi:hypothetical protein GGR56DRAFT_649892 [Xylariaceae sp. FL0804]|nr:hypothetical protein GGR56DRAFT_649892 [Xylariaceae sp. FL0804]